MPKLSFYPGFNGLMLLAVAIIVTVLVALFYRQARAALRPRQWTLLFMLRMISIGTVLLLLFRPVFSFEKEWKQRKTLVFLLDNSSSMSVSDSSSGSTRWQQARDQMVAWWSELSAFYKLRLLVFSDSAQRLENTTALADIKPTGEATSITRALLAARKTTASQSVEAVVLVSDGIQNAAGQPVRTARRLGMRIYSVGVGDPLHQRALQRDVRITDIDCPDQMAVNNRTRVTAFVEASGMPGRVVQVELHEDDQQVARQELTLDDVEGAQEVVLEFVPARKGLHTYTVKVPRRAEEKIPQNNVRSTTALVHDARIRVLYLEGTLRSEYGALVGRFLSKDPNVEFCALVQTRPNVFVQRSNIEDLKLGGIPEDPETLKTFDVFLIGDLDVTFLAPPKMQRIHDRVMEGAGLIMIGGYHSLGPGGYRGTLMEKLLPVHVGPRDIGQATETFQPKLTPAGRRHPIFANIARFFDLTGDNSRAAVLPPLGGCVKVQAPKPGATVLLTHPAEQVDGAPMVVMAVQPIGKGRAAVFTADTTRNWHQTLRTMDQETPFLRFWGQTIRWLARRTDVVETEAGMAVTTDKAYYAPGSPITIRAVVRGDDGASASGAKVEATITGPRKTATRVKLAAESGPAGNYSTVFEPPRSGRYVIDVTAHVGDQRLTSEKLEVDVGRPNLEFDRLDLDEATLVAIANESGGQYLHISLGQRLVERLKRTYQRQVVQYEVPLAWPPLLWIVFVAALTTEWYLRRRYQLR